MEFANCSAGESAAKFGISLAKSLNDALMKVMSKPFSAAFDSASQYFL